MRAPANPLASPLGRLVLTFVALLLATVSMTTPAKADEPSGDAPEASGQLSMDMPLSAILDGERAAGDAGSGQDGDGSAPQGASLASGDAPTLAGYLSGGMLRVSADVALVDGYDSAIEPVVGSFTVDGLTYAIVDEGQVALVAVSPRTLAGGLVGGSDVAFGGGSTGVPSGEDSGSGVPPRSVAEQVPLGAASPSPSPEGASSDDAEGDALVLPEAVSYDGSQYSLTAVGPRALAGCEAGTVALPASVASVDQAAFEGSPVASVEVAEGNQHYSSYDGMLFDAGLTRLLLVPEGKQGAARIPKEAEVVDPSRFSHSAGVDSIDVEAGSAAFSSRNGCLYDASGETLLRVPAGATDVQIADDGTTVAAGSLEGCARLDRAVVTADEDSKYDADPSWRVMLNMWSTKSLKVRLYDPSWNLIPGYPQYTNHYQEEVTYWKWTGTRIMTKTLDTSTHKPIRFSYIEYADGTLMPAPLLMFGNAETGDTGYRTVALKDANDDTNWYQLGTTYCYLYGKYTQYTHTVDKKGGSAKEGDTTDYTSYLVDAENYSQRTLRPLVRDGYDFDGWTVTSDPGFNSLACDGSSFDRADVNNPNSKFDTLFIARSAALASFTFTANWAPRNYQISLDLRNGAIEGETTIEYTPESEDFTLPTPTKPYYTFVGWTGSNGTTPQTKVTIEKGSWGDKTYTANWAHNTAKVRTNGDGVIDSEKKGVNSYLKHTVHTPSGKTSVGGSDGRIADTVYWSSDKATQVYSNGKNHYVHYHDTAGNLHALVAYRAGYEQTGWKTCKENGEAIEISSTSHPKGLALNPVGGGKEKDPAGGWAYEAQWKPIEYAITYDLNGAPATGNPNKGDDFTKYTIEDPKTLKAPTWAGHVFVGWDVKDTTTKTAPSTLLDSNRRPAAGTGIFVSDEYDPDSPYAKVTTIKEGTYGDLTAKALWRDADAVLQSSDPSESTTDPLKEASKFASRVKYYDKEGSLTSSTHSNTLWFASSARIQAQETSTLNEPVKVCPVTFDTGASADGERDHRVEAVRPGYDNVGWYALDDKGGRHETSPRYNPNGMLVQPVGGGSDNSQGNASGPMGVLGRWRYFALWEEHEYSITYDLNDATAGDANVPNQRAAIAETKPTSYTSFEDDFDIPAPTRPFHTFAGWKREGGEKLKDEDGNVLASGGGLTERDGGPFAKVLTVNKGTMGDIRLVAQWRANIARVYANGDGMRLADNRGATAGIDFHATTPADALIPENSGFPANSVIWNGSTMAFPPMHAGASIHYVVGGKLFYITAWRRGYTQTGWMTVDEDGVVTEISNGSNPSGMRLNPKGGGERDDGIWDYKAQWKANEYSVAFDLNGGEGAIDPVKAVFDQDLRLPDEPKRRGYVFGGWAIVGPDEEEYAFEGGALLSDGKLRPAEGSGVGQGVPYEPAVPVSYGERAVEGQEPATTATFTAKWVADLRVDVPISVDLDLTVDWEQGRVVASGPDGSEHATGEFRSWSSGEVQVAAFGQEAGTAMGHRQGALGLFASGDEAKAGNLMKVSLVLSADADGAQRLSFPLSGLYELPADRPPHGAMASPQDLAPLDLVVPPASSVSSPGTLRVRYGIECAADLPLSDVAIDERPRPILKLVYKVGLANP